MGIEEIVAAQSVNDDKDRWVCEDCGTTRPQHPDKPVPLVFYAFHCNECYGWMRKVEE